MLIFRSPWVVHLLRQQLLNAIVYGFKCCCLLRWKRELRFNKLIQISFRTKQKCFFFFVSFMIYAVEERNFASVFHNLLWNGLLDVRLLVADKCEREGVKRFFKSICYYILLLHSLRSPWKMCQLDAVGLEIISFYEMRSIFRCV